MSRLSQPVVREAIHRPGELIRAELAEVEEALIAEAASEVELLEAAARHILEAGGKRLRPQLLILSARARQYRGDRVVPLATAMELVHTATLVHDDIMDDADSRRGRVSVNYFWGNSASVLIGDYLVVQAFALVAQDGDPRLVRMLCDTIARMCEGEVLQLSFRGDTDVSIDAYLTICDYKTAMLTRCCTCVGALLGGEASQPVDALTRFGHATGMAFQIVDDILDMTGDERALGKPVGGDLREAKMTLPTIYALQRAGSQDRQALDEMVKRSASLTRSDIDAIRALIERYDGFVSARRMACDYVSTAKDALAGIPASASREALVALADQIIDRDR
jgi:octaprenyl-diphosphate synthase